VNKAPEQIPALPLTRRRPAAFRAAADYGALNIAQSCNMGCGYCYADQGKFGGAKRAMSADIARASVDRLLEWAPRNRRVVVAFMGGEPLLNRKLLHETVRYADAAAKRSGHAIAFSMTTNATLMRDEDAKLFSEFPFSITVSIDGTPQVQDRQRPMLGGGPSSARLLRGLDRLLVHRPRQLDARMTATAKTGPLLPILRYALTLGFDSAGFAPVIAAPKDGLSVHGDDLTRFTEEMIICGRHALAEMTAGRRFGFANLETALYELHRGSARAHPCGAGAGYISIDAGGEAFGCHRLVGDERFRFGGIAAGIDDEARYRHLTERAVDRQEPCRTCWARYLCGGGCYHEVAARGRTHCDYVRSWLAFCLEAYVTLSSARLDLFAGRDQSANQSSTLQCKSRWIGTRLARFFHAI
jgi:uncharacterized protein